jgi:hypothetical protein
MKPKPEISVHDMLALGDKLPVTMLPYDTYSQDRAGFVAFAIGGEFIALPLSALVKASLRAGATSIALDFGPLLVRIDGRGLDELFESILLERVRVVRTGRHPSCTIESVRIAESLGI